MAMVWTNQGRRHGNGGAEVLNWATPIADEILTDIISIMARGRFGKKLWEEAEVKVNKKSWREEEAVVIP
jgi:hypothetical protein